MAQSGQYAGKAEKRSTQTLTKSCLAMAEEDLNYLRDPTLWWLHKPSKSEIIWAYLRVWFSHLKPTTEPAKYEKWRMVTGHGYRK